MKTLSALIFPFTALAFSAIAHAAPVQYQLTAYHVSESSTPLVGIDASQTPVDPSPVAPSEYFFADGTPITATFYYDSAVPPTSSNVPGTFSGSSGTYSALTSRYSAFSNLTLDVAGHSITATGEYTFFILNQPIPFRNTLVIDSDNTSEESRDSVQGTFIGNNLTQLSFGNYRANAASIILGGYNNMLSDQSLPNNLTELSPYFTGIAISFVNSTGTQSHNVIFSNGTLSQVPLPSSALFFLSGLIGLGANIFRKAKS